MKHDLGEATLQSIIDAKRATFTVACAIIAGGTRSSLIWSIILPEVAKIDFDDVVVVGDYHPHDGTVNPCIGDVRHIPVPALTHTTNDALVKRDVAALSTDADVIWYLSDDHYPRVGTLAWLAPDDLWDVIVPMRWTLRDGERIQLNNGEQSRYCGGHGIIIKRSAVQAQPWCLGPFDRCWDKLISERHQAAGVRYQYGIAGIDIYDVEPGARPWE